MPVPGAVWMTSVGVTWVTAKVVFAGADVAPLESVTVSVTE